MTLSDAMAPRNMNSPDTDRERISVLETKIGDADSGILGELKQIRDSLRGMEVRLYGILTTLGTITYVLFGK